MLQNTSDTHTTHSLRIILQDKFCSVIYTDRNIQYVQKSLFLEFCPMIYSRSLVFCDKPQIYEAYRSM